MGWIRKTVDSLAHLKMPEDWGKNTCEAICFLPVLVFGMIGHIGHTRPVKAIGRYKPVRTVVDPCFNIYLALMCICCSWQMYPTPKHPEREGRRARKWRRYQYTHRRALSRDVPARKDDDSRQQPLFFAKLPLEIRQQIYTEFFSDWCRRRFPANVSPNVSTIPTSDQRTSTLLHGRAVWSLSHVSDYNGMRRQWLNILLTCRQMYNESLPFLYNSRTFCAHSFQAIRHLSDAILPQRLAILESLHLDLTTYSLSKPRDAENWKICCDILSNDMPRLRKFSVHLFTYEDEITHPAVRRYLDGLRSIKQPREFVVQLEQVFEGYGDAPFRFKTHAEVEREEQEALKKRGRPERMVYPNGPIVP